MNLPRISVFGLGYVGSVTAAALAERGLSVIGCDVSVHKVDLINAGKAPIGEPGLDELLQDHRSAGRVRATVDVEEAVRDLNPLHPRADGEAMAAGSKKRFPISSICCKFPIASGRLLPMMGLSGAELRHRLPRDKGYWRRGCALALVLLSHSWA